ncbi:TlpA family protein disulfide reductase [Ichthyenterobacterium magnum]|uniref:Thiol-disulfide isomerase/thioredoxin n=1 Tax=Ichthyenterobacterium magnum TaxID=1230530 RepID=A0A420DEI7_9FLAO|nr:TlpA disulfide reductase family protein [Ichthyenterobacterium magnum]RKE90790.1 thiol-disulfide isomerase/thioredoxin [Ichthyenterobacterium magnum]
MKKIIHFILITCLTFSCAEPPLQFSEEALNEKVITLDGNAITLSEVLELHQGKTVLIDVWASWCGDCIQGMPKVKAIQNQFKTIDYVFLSVDRSQAAWKRGIEKYKVKGFHYFIPKGQKGAFGKFLNSNWIPRYMVINPDGSIKLYKATKATDQSIIEALK